MAANRPQRAAVFRRGDRPSDWELLTDTGTGGTYTVSELSNGILEQSGNTIYDVNNPFNRWTFRQVGESHITVLPSGRFVFQNEVPIEQLNSLGVTASNQGVGGSFTHVLPNGADFTVDIPLLYTSAAGSSVFINRDPSVPWNERFRDVLNGPQGAAMRDAALSEGFELATPEEVIERSMVRYLLEHYAEAVHDVLNTGELDENGNKIETESEAAAYLGRLYSGELSAFVMYNYSPAIV